MKMYSKNNKIERRPKITVEEINEPNLELMALALINLYIEIETSVKDNPIEPVIKGTR